MQIKQENPANIVPKIVSFVDLGASDAWTQMAPHPP